MERALYVCPECGFAELESHKDTLTCRDCGLQVKYTATGEFNPQEPFRFFGDWYDYQSDFVNKYNPDEYREKPAFTDRADLSEVIVYDRKRPVQKEVQLQLFGDRIEIDAGGRAAAAGVLLAFGFGQGTGQALNFGNIYQVDFGFEFGRHFGLTIAALGFLSAALGGVIHLNIMRRRGVIKSGDDTEETLKGHQIEGKNEIPMQESIDKLTIQLALIGATYIVAFIFMYTLGSLFPGMKSVIFGFNFLIGVLTAVLCKAILNMLKKTGIAKKQYTNNFLLTRVSNMFFDIMVIAGIAAIRLDLLEKYWGILLILAAVGIVSTYVYNRYVANTLFPEYKEEQFMVMYGMLTGTASTGIILLREIDKEFKTPAAENLVYQQIPAIVFGFPMMFLALLAPVKPVFTWLILITFFIAMNIILFRSKILGRRRQTDRRQTNR